jgi:hypothetical protein
MLTKTLLLSHLFDCFIVIDAICHDYLQLITIVGTSLPPLKKVARGGYLSCFVPAPKLDRYRSTRRHDPSTLLENSTGQAAPSSMALISGKYLMRHLQM